jgi:parallel beta-helix repeat protein
MIPNGQVQTAIKLDGNTNNTTINNTQAYNNTAYGVYL